MFALCRFVITHCAINWSRQVSVLPATCLHVRQTLPLYNLGHFTFGVTHGGPGWFMDLSTSLRNYLFTSLSIHLSLLHLSIHLAFFLFIFVCLYLCLFVSLFVCIFVCLFVSLFPSFSFFLSFNQSKSIDLSIDLPILSFVKFLWTAIAFPYKPLLVLI